MAADLASLYAEHAPGLRVFFARRLRERHADLADDLVQQVFVRALTAAYHEQGKARPWLFRIARNLLTDFYASSYARRSWSFSALLADHQQPAYTLAWSDLEHRHDVIRLLAFLTPEQRLVVEATYLDGYSDREIRERYGIPVDGVKKRRARALATLRRLLEAA